MKDKYGFVLRRFGDGAFFEGCGYGGPGKPVPYFSQDMKDAKVFKTPGGARRAIKRGIDGAVGMVKLDTWDRAVEWLRWLPVCRKEEGPAKSDNVDGFEEGQA